MKRPIRILLVILFFVIDAFCITVVFKTHNRIKVQLIGDNTINATFGKDFSDLGFKIVKNDEEICIEGIEYDIVSDVDSTKMGEYTIKYHIKYEDKEYDLERKVNIVDDEAPIIETNLEEVTLGYCDNELISNLEYSASDNFDGILTDKVQKNESDDKYVLSVTDSNGNTTTKELKKKMGEKPNNKIVLNGRASISLELGDTYEEAGAYLTDGCGEPIEGEVVTSGSVDSNKVGKYTITYKLKDNDNIKNTRTITVYKETAKQATGSGVIYLTFDDGPSVYTSKILNVLDKYNIKATFFVTNQFSGYKNMIGEEYRRGHTIGVHSLTHNYNIYQSSQSYWNDFDAMNNIIEEQTGKKTTLLRFPGVTNNHMANKTAGKVGMSTIVNEVNEKGLHYFDWNVSVEDNGSCSSVANKQACIIKNFKTYINPNRENFVLMHDMKSYTADGLETMIQYAINMGYKFKPITEDTNPVHFKPYQ